MVKSLYTFVLALVANLQIKLLWVITHSVRTIINQYINLSFYLNIIV
jgi:hypothetical protein